MGLEVQIREGWVEWNVFSGFGLSGCVYSLISWRSGGRVGMCGGTSDVLVKIMSPTVDDILAMGCKSNFRGMHIMVTLQID